MNWATGLPSLSNKLLTQATPFASVCILYVHAVVRILAHTFHAVNLIVCCVQENLRQLCVFKLANESGQSYRWWEYVTKFGEECTINHNQYNEECAERVSSAADSAISPSGLPMLSSSARTVSSDAYSVVLHCKRPACVLYLLCN